MQPIHPADVVSGQYTGYHHEPGVAPDSETETFVALKCFVDNWRWAGVPFYLRTGKRMAEGARVILDRLPRATAVDVPTGLERTWRERRVLIRCRRRHGIRMPVRRRSSDPSRCAR